MNRRLALALQWTRHPDRVKPGSLVANVLAATCKTKARKYIGSIESIPGYYRVSIVGVPDPLYYPSEMDLHGLYQVIAEGMYPRDWHFYEIPETRIGKYDHVLDCGAAEGFFGLRAVRRCATLHLVEPVPRFLDALHLTFSLHPRAVIVPCALSDRPGTADLSGAGVYSTITEAKGASVRVETIDALFHVKGKPIDFLKADVEGFEVRLIRGAEKTIRKNKPRIAITTYHAEDHARVLTEMLRSFCPHYRFKTKGIEERAGAPVMLHAWTE